MPKLFRKKNSQQELILGVAALAFMALLIAASMVQDAVAAKKGH